jgi:catechol 2,3-dioxygenase-like lactoylglutathione lyase family enzyme
MIIDHIGPAVSDYERSRQVFQKALAPLGIELVMEGGKDNGPPGVREIYHPNYYAAFVIGPDGHNIEAVSHAPGE